MKGISLVFPPFRESAVGASRQADSRRRSSRSLRSEPKLDTMARLAPLRPGPDFFLKQVAERLSENRQRNQGGTAYFTPLTDDKRSGVFLSFRTVNGCGRPIM
jgi:hypothetical protein